MYILYWYLLLEADGAVGQEEVGLEVLVQLPRRHGHRAVYSVRTRMTPDHVSFLRVVTSGNNWTPT